MHTNEQALSLLSILPLVGQFHVDYSAAIDSIQLFRFVHEEVGKHVFGSYYKLAKKPKPFRWSLHVTVLHGGWLLVRDDILQKFKGCKCPEYLMMVHLLEEVNPLVFLHYPAIFRSGNLQVQVFTFIHDEAGAPLQLQRTKSLQYVNLKLDQRQRFSPEASSWLQRSCRKPW